MSFSPCFGQEILHFDFNEDQYATTALDKISNKSISINNHFNRPERVNASFGKALRLDGWSTYATSNEITLSGITNEFTFETWYATESFNQKEAALLDYTENSNDLYIAIGPYGNVIFTSKINGQRKQLKSKSNIKAYTWNHIVCTIDPKNNTINIYINGQLDATESLQNIISISVYPSKLMIGKRNINEQSAGFNVNTLNGAIDEISIYKNAMTALAVANKYNENTSSKVAALDIDPNIRHQGDYLRPRYHVMPNTSWANESYGLIYYNNKFHMFFQKNPNAPSLFFMHWGHFTSEDLVNWKEEIIPLRPEEGFASFGVWSGTTFFDQNSKPVIAYTGVNGAKAAIGLSYPLDDNLLNWTTQATKPIITGAPINIPNKDFRDPYVWKEGDKYYMVVGSGVANNGGGMLASYTSTDLVSWTNIVPIYKNNNINSAGVFWEMPFFNKINDKDYLLVVTPIYNGAPARCIYWLGSFDGTEFKPYDNNPKEFEHIAGRLLSPSIGLDADNKFSYIGIIPEDRNVQDQVKAGWRQTFSIPRIMESTGSKLVHRPHPNLCKARANEVSIHNKIVQHSTSNNLPEYKGNQSEMEFYLNTKNSNQFIIQVYKNDAQKEFTSIIFDRNTQKIGVNRFLSSTYSTAKDYKSESYTIRDTMHVRIFIDHSILEVFVNDEIVISSRIYPSENSRNIDLIPTDGSVEILSFKAWDIVSKEEVSLSDFCGTSSSVNSVLDEAIIQVYPNPLTSDTFIITTPAIESNSDYALSLYTLAGIPIDFEAHYIGNDSLQIKILRKQDTDLILGKLKVKNSVQTFKMMLIK